MDLLFRKGDTGGSVKQIQRRLRRLGFAPGLLDGDFGPLTERAVKEFQRRKGIKPDGIVGPETLAILFPREDGIFVCYRREDTADTTERICDRLRAQYGREAVFKDVDSIPASGDFREYLFRKLARCRVVLAVIGPDWLSCLTSRTASHMQDPADFVRTELEYALRRGISIVPVLVKGTSMPESQDLPDELSQLAFHQTATVRLDPDFDRDVGSLITTLNRVLSTVASDNW